MRTDVETLIIETLISTLQGQGEAVGVPRETIIAVVRLLRTDGTKIYGGSIGPREPVFNGWKSRGEFYEEHHAPVQGYEALLKEMSRMTEDSLRIVSISDTESWFDVFITPSYDGLIGVLHIPIQACKEFAIRMGFRRPQT